MRLSFLGALITAAMTFTACGDGSSGPLTKCDLSYKVKNEGGKGFGEACSHNDECLYGACVLPEASGNITNALFGFCSRGCDCNEDTESNLVGNERQEFSCLYPSGYKNFHHVVKNCRSLSECQAIDPRYTECSPPDSGGINKICQAFDDE